MKTHSLNELQAAALDFLRREHASRRRATPETLAEGVGVGRATARRLVDELLEKGLARREGAAVAPAAA